ncbi:MAG: phytanoyl-CoA dioxygenase family protein [Acidobacteria bacterium]|nr:phytanoyl-CoA dioxygenase family protein [Acidobacteriota bacterium]
MTGSLTRDSEHFYREFGFATVENFFDDRDLNPVVQELEREVDRRARTLYDVGRLPDLFANEPFERRLARLYDFCPDAIEALDVKNLLTPRLFRLLTHRKVVDLARDLLRADIVLNPTHRLRTKMPQATRTRWAEVGRDPLPLGLIWHQDALSAGESDPFAMVTVWVPLVDATAENGCLAMMPGAFRLGRLPHHDDEGGRIHDEALPAVTPHPVPCARGAIIFFNQFTPHCSLPNMTDRVRWSVDFRFHAADSRRGRAGLPAFLVYSEEASDRLIDYEAWRRGWISLRTRG